MSRSDHAFCTAHGDGITLSLYIQPRASKNEVCGVQDNSLRIRLTSPPVDGAANKLCREFVADFFGVPKSAVKIISGETSRHKRVFIHGNAGRLARVVEALASPDS
ncbi:MAG: DUF167 family protein [Desulfuromonadales bacterium]